MSKTLTNDFELDDIINHIKKSVDKNKEKKKKQDSEKEIHLPFGEKKEKDEINEKKLKNEIFGDSMIDYYSIVGASREDSQETIIKKCNQKMAEYHQDKIKSKLLKYPVEERKKHQARYQMQYELVREARDYLSNPEKRKYYDMQKKSLDNNNFVNKRQSL
jgi:DnaJ-domain-containing protein 1